MPSFALKCKATAKLRIKANGEKVVQETNNHTCKVSEEEEFDDIFDAEEQMKTAAEKMVVAELKMSAAEISKCVLDQFKERFAHKMYKGLHIKQLKGIVYRARRAEFADWAGRIESFPLVYTSTTDERLFLQFNLAINVEGKLHRIIGWAHPYLLFQLKDGKV